MSERDDEDIRRLLTGAVPPLPGPADRLAEVGARVRRRRYRTGGAGLVAAALVVGLAVGLAVGTPQLLADRTDQQAQPAGPPIGEVVCPTTTEQPPMDANGSVPGKPLVPTGAVEVTACEVPMPGPDNPQLNEPRVLTTGVDDVVASLNGLSPVAPVSPGAARACHLAAFGFEYAFVLRYPDREPVTVRTDRNCGSAWTGENRRIWRADVLFTFFTHYRAQLVAETDPASIPTPSCAPTIPVQRLRIGQRDGGTEDNVATNTADDYWYPSLTEQPQQRVVLPTELAAAAICRYEVNRGQAKLDDQRTMRAGAEELRSVLNHAFSDGVKPSECSNPPERLPTAFHSIVVADATGATAEFWVWTAPCQAAILGRAERQPTSELLALLG